MQVRTCDFDETLLCLAHVRLSVLWGDQGLKERLNPFEDIGMKGQRVILKLFVDSIISYQKCSR